MMSREGRIYWLIGLLLVFLIVAAGLATWPLTARPVHRHIVEPGETLADLASEYRLHEQVIVEQNDLRPGSLLTAGQVLFVPQPPLGLFVQWKQQLLGLGATMIGALLCAWLSNLSGLLPSRFGLRVLVIAVITGLTDYLTTQLISSEASLVITPLFVLNAVVSGFAWTAILLLLARALGSSRQLD
jgi:LysM repeat protein